MAEPDWPALTDALHARQRGRCAGCARPLTDGVRHHRQRRAIGGHGLDNLVLLHDSCHKWIHHHPTIARDHGLIISSYFRGDHATIPTRTIERLRSAA